MPYKLFIDDERFPVKPDWFVCRSSREAIDAVSHYGLPEFISFDHDLGGDDTSMRFIDWLLNRLLDGDITIDEPFDFTVHSQNPIGAKNIENRMRSIIKHFK